MFSRKKTFLIVAVFLIGVTTYMIFNREHFVQEHLNNQNPTLFSLQKEIDETKKNLKALDEDYQSLKQQGQAQSSQAAAAMASLKAIPAGTPNTLIPSR